MNDLMVPYFCYGTLRPGCGNDAQWYGLAEARGDGHVHAHGYALLERGIPFAVPIRPLMEVRPDIEQVPSPAVGCLLYPFENVAGRLRVNLDRLEGHPYGYYRQPIVVNYEGGTVLAWIYTYPHLDDMANPQYSLIPSGDYCHGQRMALR